MPEHLRNPRCPPDTPPDDWSIDMERLFSRARYDAGLVYGCWRVEEIPHEAAYRVKDLKGNLIVVVKHRGLADLIASLPDLCDINLRPSKSGVVTCDVSGDRRAIPYTGISHPQAAFDSGYGRGYDDGNEAGFANATAGQPEVNEPEDETKADKMEAALKAVLSITMDSLKDGEATP